MPIRILIGNTWLDIATTATGQAFQNNRLSRFLPETFHIACPPQASLPLLRGLDYPIHHTSNEGREQQLPNAPSKMVGPSGLDGTTLRVLISSLDRVVRPSDRPPALPVEGDSMVESLGIDHVPVLLPGRFCVKL